MRKKIEYDTYKMVEQLVERAISASSKKEADIHIKQMENLHRSGRYEGYVNIAFAQLICSTKSAAGRVNNKESKCAYVRQDLYKLQGQIEKPSNSE